MSNVLNSMLKVNYGKVYNVGKKHVQMAVSNGLKEDIVFVPSAHIFAFEIHSGKRISQLGGHYGAATCCLYHGCFQVFQNSTFSFNFHSFDCSRNLRKRTCFYKNLEA